MSSSFRLGLAQLEVEPGAEDANVERGLAAVAEAADRDCDLVVLPELFTVGYFAFEAYERSAASVEAEPLTEFAAAAASEGIAVLAGTVIEDLAASADDGVTVPSGKGYANTAVLFDATGERQLLYRKHHLFGYGSAERDRLVAGAHLPTTDVGPFTVGVTTCYDLRFPTLYRELVDDGATLLLVPSAWPDTRGDHWDLFGRTRAVENQCFLAAANGVGRFEDADLLGRSAVYDPWGPTVAGAADEPTLVTADLDPDRVRRVREEFPALADRRD